MRIASWLFVVCAVLGVAAVFLPAIEVRVRGLSLGRPAAVSLYQVSTNRKLVRGMVMELKHGRGKRAGEIMVGALAPRIGGRTGSLLDDARSAMRALDDIDDRDAERISLGVAVALWTLIGAQVAMVLLIIAGALNGVHRGWRLALALVLALVVTAIAGGFAVACELGATEINAEIGYRALTLAVGAYAPAIAAAGALVSLIALVIIQLITGRARARAAARPFPAAARG